MPDPIVERANKRSRRHVYRSEMLRMIRAFRSIGAPDELIDKLSEDDVLDNLLDETFYEEPVDSFQEIWDADWATTGPIVIIDGGDELDRRKVMQLLAMKAVVANASKSGGVWAKNLQMSDVVIKFNDFGFERANFMKDLLSPSVLIIDRVEVSHRFRDNSDGRDLFNVLLVTRRDAGNPTFLILHEPTENFEASSNLLGGRFTDAINSKHDLERGVVRVRVLSTEGSFDE